jgi:hypothetical protein
MDRNKIFEHCKELLTASVGVILSEKTKDPEFNLAVNSIKTALEYLSSIRKPDER